MKLQIMVRGDTNHGWALGYDKTIYPTPRFVSPRTEIMKLQIMVRGNTNHGLGAWLWMMKLFTQRLGSCLHELKKTYFKLKILIVKPTVKNI
ncbi:hypothetical protein ACFOG5_22935 [Pedobacter fastidiosus]|uniref:Uncharacterized protein n=1 Tax=Pedobacter fastidiosus TaxID=2765361 RepID=A0ABR7KTN4_9SPHI|nr:hypothetical protein [Pedobacter fastidiosus]MBC6111450.1 hypothetical protein [Pedobacter fastidiosus]